jgi:NAD(P)-dependent dehydrogenase (short-subunit alcohol dehydrogenase family)
MERYLEGKSALVTGSSRGIGRVIATHLAALGASVSVHGTTPYSSRAFNEAESLEAVARDIAAETGSIVLPVHGDLTAESSVRRIVEEVRARFGRVDILVNNAGGDVGAAGIAGPGGGEPNPNDCVYISVADIRSVLDRNLLSCILVCREVAPEMMERHDGRIVNVSSTGAFVGREKKSIYAVAKAGMVQYTRCLAAQLRRYNVLVNTVAPGSIPTARFVATRPVDESMMLKDGTLERYGWPIEVARAVAFLVAPDTTYTTGQVLRVDGGAQLWPA